MSCALSLTFERLCLYEAPALQVKRIFEINAVRIDAPPKFPLGGSRIEPVAIALQQRRRQFDLARSTVFIPLSLSAG